MKAFVPGWMTMAGPSSAKAGMQGDGGSVDGTNCFYDEMIDELTDGDGSNKTEYWKRNQCTSTRWPPSTHPGPY